MFESSVGCVADLDEAYESLHPADTPESEVFDERMLRCWQEENQAAAAQLAVIGQLFAHRLAQWACHEFCVSQR